MCQIIQGPSAQLKSVLLTTAGLLEELHQNNPDGWGALYHTTKGVKAIKKLPMTAEDTRKFIQKLPDDDRPVALHWRWKTSGLVDQANAHPHHIEGGWLIHNGVLDIDTKSKPEMCDTYHFARAYLDGAVTAVVHSNGLQQMIGEFIGNNRFVIMDNNGDMCIINKHQGYEAQGLWFANTYSMSRHLVDPSCPKPTYNFKQYKGFKSYPKSNWTGGVYQGIDAWDEIDYEAMGSHPAAAAQGSGYSQSVNDEVDEYIEGIHDDVDMAVLDCDAETLTMCLEDYPLETLRHIFETYEITPYDRVGEDDLTPAVVAVRQNLVDGDILVLLNRMEDDIHGIMTDRIASTLCWYCVAEPKMEALA